MTRSLLYLPPPPLLPTSLMASSTTPMGLEWVEGLEGLEGLEVMTVAISSAPSGMRLLAGLVEITRQINTTFLCTMVTWSPFCIIPLSSLYS